MNKKATGLLLLAVVLVFSLFCVCSPQWIVPAGYELAVDGIVVARMLALVFFLSRLWDLAMTLWKKGDRDV